LLAIQRGQLPFRVDVTGRIRSRPVHDPRRPAHVIRARVPADGTTARESHRSDRRARDQVTIEGKRATGVEYLRGGKTLRAHAAREVILASGTFKYHQS
jgi:choline dehydrogenase-like flavoprotein